MPNFAKLQLDTDEIEQAFSYAFHPEIRAVYFVLCNGRKIDIYKTENAPDTPPIFSLEYGKFQTSFGVLHNILGPNAIKRDFPDVNLDLGKPLADGLRSFARFTSGYITYNSNSLNLRPLQGMTTSIAGGAVERDEEGRIVSVIQTRSPYQSLQELNEKLGLSEFEVSSTDEYISRDKKFPTRFVGQKTLIIPAGEEILDLQSWQKTKMPFNVTCITTTTAVGYLLKFCKVSCTAGFAGKCLWTSSLRGPIKQRLVFLAIIPPSVHRHAYDRLCKSPDIY